MLKQVHPFIEHCTSRSQEYSDIRTEIYYTLNWSYIMSRWKYKNLASCQNVLQQVDDNNNCVFLYLCILILV